VGSKKFAEFFAKFSTRPYIIYHYFMNSDITEQYLNRFYEDLHREQMTLMNSMKSTTEKENEKSITKQITQINQLMLGSLRLRNLRKQLSNNSI
jgi:hypothetical protein